MLAIDSEVTNAVCGRLGSNSLRIRSYRWKSGTCARKVPRKRLGTSLFGSAANVQHGMHVGLGQPAEAPTQTVERLDKALKTLQCIGRFACDASSAKAWMLVSR